MNNPIDFNTLSAHSSAEESPGFLLWKVSTHWRRSIEEVLKPLGLTHPQFVILATTAYLTRAGSKISQVEIGRYAALDPNTTSQILRSLETKKLITRCYSVDERSKCPMLTPSGVKTLEQTLPAVEQADAQFFSSIDLKQTSMIEALQHLAQK